MISKGSRRYTSSVENLKQGGFTAVKGIDETASPLDTEHVTYLENLDIDSDGGLVLRKPIYCLKKFSTHKLPNAVRYLFDKAHLLIASRVHDATSPNSVLKYAYGIYDNDTLTRCRLCWTSWKDSAFKNIYLHADTQFSNKFTEYLDFTEACFINTPTSTICTSVRVNVGHPDLQPDLYNENLYETVDDVSTVYLYRMVIITKSTDPSCDFDLTIVTPEVTTVNSSDTLRLDPNLNADNPYAIRDVYNSLAPTIKNIIAYTKATFVNDIPVLATGSDLISDTYENNEYTTAAYTESTSNLDDVKWYPLSDKSVCTLYLRYNGNSTIPGLNWNAKNCRVSTSLGFRTCLECNATYTYGKSVYKHQSVIPIYIGTLSDSTLQPQSGTLTYVFNRDPSTGADLPTIRIIWANYSVTVGYSTYNPTGGVAWLREALQKCTSKFYGTLFDCTYDALKQSQVRVKLDESMCNTLTQFINEISGDDWTQVTSLYLVHSDTDPFEIDHTVMLEAPLKTANNYSMYTYNTSPEKDTD